MKWLLKSSDFRTQFFSIKLPNAKFKIGINESTRYGIERPHFPQLRKTEPTKKKNHKIMTYYNLIRIPCTHVGGVQRAEFPSDDTGILKKNKTTIII